MYAKQYLCLYLERYRSLLVGALEIGDNFAATVTSYKIFQIII